MDLLQELRFAGGWVSDDTDVDIASEMNAFSRFFMYSSHQLEQDTLLDNFMACPDP